MLMFFMDSEESTAFFESLLCCCLGDKAILCFGLEKRVAVICPGIADNLRLLAFCEANFRTENRLHDKVLGGDPADQRIQLLLMHDGVRSLAGAKTALRDGNGLMAVLVRLDPVVDLALEELIGVISIGLKELLHPCLKERVQLFALAFVGHNQRFIAADHHSELNSEAVLIVIIYLDIHIFFEAEFIRFKAGILLLWFLRVSVKEPAQLVGNVVR